MKKILATLLVMIMSVSLLVGCGSSDKDSNKGNDSNVNSDVDTNEDSDANVGQDNDVTETDNEGVSSDESSINPNYESVELSSGNAVAKIYYDPEQVKVREYGNWMTLQGIEKNTILFNMNIKECESADAYAKEVASGFDDWALAKTSELEEVKFGDVTTKHFTLTYNEKSYQSDEKLDNLTQEEIDNLEYTLNEKTREYYVIEVSEGTILYVAYGESNKMELFEYVVIEAIK